jgi:hypothetical protein
MNTKINKKTEQALATFRLIVPIAKAKGITKDQFIETLSIMWDQVEDKK